MLRDLGEATHLCGPQHSTQSRESPAPARVGIRKQDVFRASGLTDLIGKSMLFLSFSRLAFSKAPVFVFIPKIGLAFVFGELKTSNKGIIIGINIIIIKGPSLEEEEDVRLAHLQCTVGEAVSLLLY